METTPHLPARPNYPLLVLKSTSRHSLKAERFHSALPFKLLPTVGKAVSKRNCGENVWTVGWKPVVIRQGKEAWRGGRRTWQFEGLLQYKKRLESYFSMERRKIDESVSFSSLSVESFSPPRLRPCHKQESNKPLTRGNSQRSSDFYRLLAPCGNSRSRLQKNSKKSASGEVGWKRTASTPIDGPRTLHYQQLFLHSSPSPALLQRLPTLIPLFLPSIAHPGLVLVILFDGVLGDLHKACPYDDSPYQLRLRDKAVEGLKALQTHVRLVLICSFSKKLCHCLVTHFRACGVCLEAGYRLRFPKEDWCRRQFLCYNRLESDLRIDNFAEQMMTLNALRLSQEDLQSPKEALICTKKGSKWCLNAEFVPVSLPARELPISCWVPDLQSQAVPFDRLADSLLTYIPFCSTDWSSGFTTIPTCLSYPQSELTNFFCHKFCLFLVPIASESRSRSLSTADTEKLYGENKFPSPFVAVYC